MCGGKIEVDWVERLRTVRKSWNFDRKLWNFDRKLKYLDQIYPKIPQKYKNLSHHQKVTSVDIW